MTTLHAFVERNKIRVADCVMVDENPHMKDTDMYHYKMTLDARIDGRRSQLTTFFSVGYGWTREPNAEDLLECLASDAASIENARSFEEWAGEMGYDEDSRKAERTFKICQQQAAKLKRFLGEDQYKALLWSTERQ